MKIKCEFNENVKKPIKRRYSKINSFDCVISSPSTSSSSVPNPSQLIQTDCHICGDKATGKHYGN